MDIGGQPTLHGRFLSTPSARRATPRSHSPRRIQGHFYPRPPRGGRRFAHFGICPDFQFLSTPSARRATPNDPIMCQSYAISIHALREEGDRSYLRALRRYSDFYPRPPRGGRPTRTRCILTALLFLSTPSARRATAFFTSARLTLLISIHALREEGDLPACVVVYAGRKFLSTPSARRATLEGY